LVDYLHQHYIPASYLKAWCDTSTNLGQKPHIWIISKKDNQNKQHKSPYRFFFEDDIYTVSTEDGERDTQIENFLSKVENEFVNIRDNKLNKHLEITDNERINLCIFVAAMYSRTIAFREKLSKQWNVILGKLEEIQKVYDNSSPEKQLDISMELSSPLKDDGEYMAIEDIQNVVNYPLQSLLPTYVQEISSLLYKIPLIILETTESHYFISSDNPCVKVDPSDYQDPKPFGSGGFGSPTIEITMPLSPKQTIFFGNNFNISSLYHPIHDYETIHRINLRTKNNSLKFYISNNREHVI
jgi:hypothetical protein